ncbi:3-hydroxybutyryl-CoA dehydrogenase [Klenkia taihuensis]|nr:3-hydroxybutyryl-CoA dehydrogenase [Klenkia taihuensis]
MVGGGAMGSQIAMVCALAGRTVHLVDTEPASLVRAEGQLRARLASRVEKGRLRTEDRDAAFARLHLGTDLEAGAGRADLVIEAVVEKIDVKTELFARLDRITPERTILTSNSSSFVPSRLAAATRRPDRVCNLHFFNPALVMACVEVVPGEATSPATLETATAFTRELGKEPVLLSREINGFLANRILNAVRDEAVHLYEGGYASLEAIDLACRTALGHPQGPFELQDLTGLDIAWFTKTARYAETGDPADLPSTSLDARVAAGHLGRKTGRGWYQYAADGTKQPAPDPIDEPSTPVTGDRPR